MKRRQRLVGLLLLPCLYGVLMLGFNAGLGRWALERWVNATQPALAGSFRCERVHLTPTLRAELTGIHLQLRDHRETYDVTLPRVTLDASLLRVLLRRQLALTLTDGSIVGRQLAVEGVSCVLRGPLPGTMTTALQPVGPLHIRILRAGQLAVNHLEGTIVQSGQRYAVDPLVMQALSGELRGTFTVELPPKPRVTLALQASRLALGDLAPLNAAMFQGARGTLHGTIRLMTDVHGLASFDGAFAADVPGGTIGSSCLQVLLPYLPNTVERARLEQAMAHGAPVPFQSAALSLTLADPQHIKTVLNMAIPEYNVHVSNVTLDIHLDSPVLLMQLFECLGRLQ